MGLLHKFWFLAAAVVSTVSIVGPVRADQGVLGLGASSPARWSMTLRSTAGFMSNPTLTPDDDDRSADGGAFVQQQLYGYVQLWRSGSWRVALSGQAFVRYPSGAPAFRAIAFRPNLSIG